MLAAGMSPQQDNYLFHCIKGALSQAVVVLRSVIFESRREYAALDGTSPTDTGMGMQREFLGLPDGWEFAPTEPPVVSEVIRKFPWGTAWLVCRGAGVCHRHWFLIGVVYVIVI